MELKHTDLYITILETKEAIEKYGSGYKYLIKDQNFSHCAFRTEEGLNYWLKITGLKIGKKIEHLWNTYHIEGIYFENSILGINPLTKGKFKINAKEKEIRNNLLDGTKLDLNSNCAWLSNGNYTKGYVEKSDQGNIIHYLNPNEHKRIIYPYFAIVH